ncbi:MAG: carboxylate-amine ligase, partial [Actinobacteria bacterium]|nr:carboxylate-amine ligase [Actinomycetota bacterium]
MSTESQDPFSRIQQRLGALGSRALSDLDRGCIVVLPSITFLVEELRKIVGIGRYEERLLCLLLLLDKPELEMVFVTSLVVDPEVVDYYLSFVRDPEGARDRLTLVSLDDPDPAPLSEKLLEAPAGMAALRNAVHGKEAYLLPFNVTAAERAIATAIGAPLYGPRPGLAYAGSKSGSRHVAREAGVGLLPGSEDLHSVDALNTAIDALRTMHPEIAEVVIKLNYGFSGQGNVVVSLDRWSGSVLDAPATFCASEESWDSFLPKIERDGGIVEQMLRAPGMVSPSVQLRVAPDGSVEVLSTHDQILGGPDDQVYLGCRFPADPSYRAEIIEAAARIGKILAAKGVVGAFGMDFLVVARDDGHDVFLSEINLRLGGTSHPFYMARFATRGRYDQATGELMTTHGPVCYMATDNLRSDRYRALSPGRVI